MDVASFLNSIPILSEGHVCVRCVCLCECFRVCCCVLVFLCVLLREDGAYILSHILLYARYLLANNMPS